MIDPPPGGVEDLSLITRLRAGDAAALDEIMREHGARMLATAKRVLRNEEDAKDAVQDAFISAFRSIGGFQESCSLGTWLHRIVVNAALMKLRKSKRRQETPIDDLLPLFDETGHHAAPVHGWSRSAEEMLLDQEMHALVRQQIDMLPDSWRTVLLLRDIEELSTEEAARLLGVTPTAVKLRLHRARLALRTRLDGIVGARRQ